MSESRCGLDDDATVPNVTLDMSEAEALKSFAKRVERFLRAVFHSCWKQRCRLLADGQGRLLADGPQRSSADGPQRSSADGPQRSSADGPQRSSADGPQRFVCGWPAAVVCGWPAAVVCGWPAAVCLRMARSGRLRMARSGRPRMARSGRPWMARRGRLRMARVVCGWLDVPDGRRGKLGWIRVLCALAARPWRRTTDLDDCPFRAFQKKRGHAHTGTGWGGGEGGGCARVRVSVVRIQNPLLAEHCAFWEVIRLFQSFGCVRNKLQFRTVQQNQKSFPWTQD